jgi:hypothetical protein
VQNSTPSSFLVPQFWQYGIKSPPSPARLHLYGLACEAIKRDDQLLGAAARKPKIMSITVTSGRHNNIYFLSTPFYVF